MATVDRLDFSNETFSSPGNNLPEARISLATVSSGYYGYFGGGRDPSVSPNIVDKVDRIDFSNETFSSLTHDLTQARLGLAAVSSNSYGYFGGGQTSNGTEPTVDRLDFFNETTSAPGNNLPQERFLLAAVSSSSYGYFGGGRRINPSFNSDRVERLDFSNETVSEPGENLTLVRYGLAAVSSSSYGYFGGGFNAGDDLTRVDRLDFSNETTSDIGDLPQARSGLAAVSSSSYGYFGGGETPSQNLNLDRVDRIDFSNDTLLLPGNNLPAAKESMGALSN